jgi:hypothetical protein
MAEMSRMAKRLVDMGLAWMKLDFSALESIRKGALEKMALV